MMASTLLLLGCALSIASGESVTTFFDPLTSVPEIIDMVSTSEATIPNGESAAPIESSGETSEALQSGDPAGKDPIPEEVSEGPQSSVRVGNNPEDESSSIAAGISFSDGRKSRAEEIFSGESQRPWPYPGVLVRAVGGRVDPSILSERFGRFEYAGNGLFRSALGTDSNTGGTSDQTRTLGSSVDVRSSRSSDGSENIEDAKDSGMSAGSSGSPVVVENGPSESEPLEETSNGSQDADSGSINEGVSIDNSTSSS